MPDLTIAQWEAVTASAAPKGAKSAAQVMTEQVLLSVRLIRGLDGNVYAVEHASSLALPLRGNGGLRQKVQRDYFAATKKVASSQALTDCISQLEAEGAVAERVQVATRVARFAEGVIVDLGRTDQQVVQITRQGWELRKLSPDDPLFRRPPPGAPGPHALALEWRAGRSVVGAERQE